MGSWKRGSAEFLRLAFLVLLVLLLHLTVIHRVRIHGVAPDLLILLVIYISLWRGAISGTVGGFLIGLLEGLSSPVYFGSHALAKSIVGFGVGKLGPHVVRESTVTQAAIVVGAFLVHDLIFLPITLDGAGSFFAVVGTRTLPGAFYSAGVGCLIYRFVLRPIGLDLASHGASVH